MACWLESLSCEVAELAARDMNNLEMHFIAKRASSLLLISTINTSKSSEIRHSEASGWWSAVGAKKLEMRRRAMAASASLSITCVNATKMSLRAVILAAVGLPGSCSTGCSVDCEGVILVSESLLIAPRRRVDAPTDAFFFFWILLILLRIKTRGVEVGAVMCESRMQERR